MNACSIHRLASRCTGLVLFFALALGVAAPAAAQSLELTVGPDFGKFSLGHLDIQLTATGGSGPGPYTWHVIAGELPPGLTIRPDGPSWFPASATAGIIGVATTPGTYSFTLRVSDGAATADRACTLKIVALVVKDNWWLPEAFVGESYSYQLTALDSSGPVSATWAPTGPVPPGMSLSTSGLVSGSPTAAGSYWINFSYTYGGNTLYSARGVNVYAVQITTPGLLPNATQYAPYTATLEAAGGTAPYTFTPDWLPTGLVLDGFGTLSGTPTGGIGRSRFWVSVTDATGVSTRKFMSLCIVGVPAMLPNIELYNFTEPTIGQPWSVVFSVSKGGTAPFGWSVTGLPPGLSIRSGSDNTSSGVSPGDVEVWGTPTETGTFTMQLTVTDANGATATSALFPIHVSTLAQVNGLPNGEILVSYSARNRISGGLPPYSVSQTGGRWPAGIVFDPLTLTLSGTPLESGSFGAQYLATDAAGATLNFGTGMWVSGGASSTVSVSTGYDLGVTTVGYNYSRQLDACCAPPYVWSLVAGSTLPPGISLAASGLLSGSPTLVGTYTFFVKASDPTNAANAGVRELRLQVDPVSSFSITNPGELPYGNLSTLYSTWFSASGGTAPYAWTLVPYTYLPPGLTLESNGQLRGTPTGGGQFNFQVMVKDANNQTLTRGFNISVYPAGQTPALGVTVGPNLGTHALGEMFYQLTATGGAGTGTYEWSVVAGALPPGLAVKKENPGWFPASVTAGIIGIATTPGTYTFTLRVSKGGQTVDRACTMTIAPLALKDNWNMPDAFVGDAYTYQLTALDLSGPVAATFAPNNSMPPGMSLSSSGLLSGTPTTAGYYNFGFSYTYGGTTVGTGRNFYVYDLRVTTPGLLPDAAQFVPYTATIVATGGTATYTFTSGGLPSGLTLDPATGVLAGTPSWSGVQYFQITATDSAAVSYVKYLTLYSAGPPTVPGVSPGHRNDFTFAVPSSMWFYNYGGRPPFSWSAEGLPPGMSIRTGVGSNYPGVGEVWGAPTRLGTFNVRLTVTDADGVVGYSPVFPLRVSELQERSGLVNGTLDVPYSSTMYVIGGTGPYTASLDIPRLPTGLALNSSTLAVTGTPRETGSYGGWFTIADASGLTLQGSRSIWINGAGTATMSMSTGWDLGSTTVGSTYSRQLSACCVPWYVWSLVDGSLPPGVTVSSTGLLFGAPTTAGTYSFLVRVEDSTNPDNYAQRQFTLVVRPGPAIVTQIPIGGVPYGNVGTPYTAQYTASGGSGALTWSVAPFNYLPPGLTLLADGKVTGTPEAPGAYSATAYVTDTAGNLTSRSVSISIYPAGVIPPLFLPLNTGGTYTLGSFRFTLAATGGVPPYTYSLTPGADDIPGMRVQSGSPLPPSWTSTGAYFGVITTGATYRTSIRVTDNAGTVSDRLVMIDVSPLLVPSATPPRATVGTFYSHTLSASGGSGNYVWSPSTSPLPAGLTIDSSGRILGIPTMAGSPSGYVVVTDVATSKSMTFGFTFFIDPFAITTAGVLPRATVGAPYNQTLIAPGCGSGCVWSTPGGLPSWLSLSADGVLSGTPTAITDTTVYVQVAGSNGTVQKYLALAADAAAPQPLTITLTTLGPTFVGSNVGTLLVAQGGTAPYAWSVASGTLPPGVALREPGETLSYSYAPGATYLFGRAGQIGVFDVTLAVTDFVGTTVTRAFSWNITPLSVQYTSLPVASGAVTNPPLLYDTPYTQPLLAIGGTGQYTWTPTGPMPPGLVFESTTGLVSGTPTNTGSFSTPFTVTDTAGHFTTFTENFNISSGTSGTVSFGLSLASSVQQATTYSTSIFPSGGTPPYTVTALTPLPAGFALMTGNALFNTTASAELRGIPQAPGTIPITLRVDDSAGNFAVRTTTVTVVPFTLLFGSTSLPDGTVGQPYSFPLTTTGGSVTWSVGPTSALPPGLTLGASALGGAPTYVGIYSFVLVAADGATGLSTSLTYSLRVSGISIADASVLPNATTGVPYSYTFTSTGGSSAPVWSGGPPASSGLTLSPAGVLSGTPTFVGQSNMTVTATDGVAPFSRMFTLYVVESVSSLLSFSLSLTTFDVVVGQRLNRILSTPSGGVPPITWSVAPGSSLPPGLALLSGPSMPATSPYSPGQSLLAGVPQTIGEFSFDLIATDTAGAQMRRTFTVNVTPVMIFSGSPRVATVGVPYAQQFPAVGGTPPYTFTMRPQSASYDMLPPGLQFSSDGLISGTPQCTGYYPFTLQVQDSAGRRYSANYSFYVYTASGLRVTGYNPSVWVGSWRTAQTLSASDSTGAVSAFTWSKVGGSLPPGVALVPGTIAGTTQLAGAPTQPGTYAYTLRAADAANPANYAEQTLTYRVAPMQVVSPRVGIAPVINLPVGQVGAAYSTTIKMAGGTPPYTFAVSPLSPLPPGLALSIAGVLSGTPQGIGTYSITPVVTDASGAVSSSYSLTLLVASTGSPAPLSRPSTELQSASVGVPYGFALDSGLRGGTAPFSWVPANGSTLPPGLVILTGANGVPTYLSGIPTAAGVYSLTFVVTDAGGQSLTTTSTLVVSSLALSPDVLGAGRVGVAYPTVTFQPSGGSPPYTFQVSRSSDLPPGLSFDPAGLLSGTPTYAGNFTVRLTVTDAGGKSLAKNYTITIDNALGEAPAVSLRPKPIQVYYELGLPAPAPVPITVDATSGTAAFTAALLDLPGATLSAGSGTAPTTLHLGLDAGALALGTHTGLLGVSAPVSANGFDWVPVTLTVAQPPPCTYTLSAAGGSAPAKAGTYSFTVATGAWCAWTATISSPDMGWISISGAASGIGPATITYTLKAYSLTIARSGTITVAGQVYTITQFGLTGCAYTLTPALLAAPAAERTASVAVTASNSSCIWPTTSGLDVTPASGPGSKTVTVTIPANPEPAPRALTATIAGKTLTVNQTGADCTVSLSPYDASFAPGGDSGVVEVTTPAGCAYAAEPGASWITVTSGGSGSGPGSVVYKVSPNSTTVGRTAALTIGAQKLQITQEAQACSVTLDTTGLGSPYGMAATSGTIAVTANGANCGWTASSGAAWATVSPASGTGNGTVTVSVASNAASAASRVASLGVAGQTVSVSQAGTTCTYALQSATGSVPASGGSGAVGVVAPGPCGWTSTPNNPDWLTIAASGSGGSSNVQFVAVPNTSPTPRVGTLTIAALTYTVTQAGAPCSYTLAASGTTVASAGSSGSVGFTAASGGCTPTAVSYAGWIAANTVFAGTTGTIDFTVAANETGYARSGTIQLGDRSFTILQNGGACAYSLHAYGAVFGASGGNGDVFASQGALGCVPVVGTTQPTIVALGALSGPDLNIFTQLYTVARFDSLNPAVRIATITFGGQFFTVKQRSW